MGLFDNIKIELDDSKFGNYLFNKYSPPSEENILRIKEEVEGSQITEEVNKVEEVSENVTEDSTEVKPSFTINDYVFEKDGTVRLRNSSVEDVIKESISTTGLANIVMNNSVIKEIVPNINPEDIFIKDHMLLMKVKREEVEEIYRIDIIGTNILVMAPTESTFQDLESGEEYNFVSVPINTELGKKILSTKDYKIKSTDNICIKDSIFRLYQNAA